MEQFINLMDKFTFMLPVLLVLVVVVYYLATRGNPESDLYWNIVHDDCQKCGGHFRVIHLDLSDRGPMTIECEKCGKHYKMDHILQQAWEL